MAKVRIALANIPYPENRDDAVARVVSAIGDASAAGAMVVCFLECYVPGYRTAARSVEKADAAFLERAWAAVAKAAAHSRVTVVLGTERITERGVLISALVINDDGTIAGFQDKRQIDRSEETIYVIGNGSRVFHAGPMCFGIAICHQGWRYPETVRWAMKRGAQVVFHPHFHEAEPGSHRPKTSRIQRNTFREGRAVPRRREHLFLRDGELRERRIANHVGRREPGRNGAGIPTYGKAGLLIADIDLGDATRLLATRCKDY